MGNCFSSRQNDDSGGRGVSHQRTNKPLVPVQDLAWSSTTPMTRNQLIQQRDMFWETEPTYSGRREIWQALKSICENDDRSLAQAIFESANIYCPTGNLTEGCYDELGNFYVIPNYCLADPSNLIQDDEERTLANAMKSSPSLTGSDDKIEKPASLDESQHSLGSSTSALFPKIDLTVRLSTGQDLHIPISKLDNIGVVRNRLYNLANLNKDEKKVKFFYLGKLLEDKTMIQDLKLHNHALIQALVQ